jgi:hypothetical protein
MHEWQLLRSALSSPNDRLWRKAGDGSSEPQLLGIQPELLLPVPQEYPRRGCGARRWHKVNGPPPMRSRSSTRGRTSWARNATPRNGIEEVMQSARSGHCIFAVTGLCPQKYPHIEK